MQFTDYFDEIVEARALDETGAASEPERVLSEKEGKE